MVSSEETMGYLASRNPSRSRIPTAISSRPSEDLPLPDIDTLEFCIQVQIRYVCGHSLGGEFIKCPRHMYTEDERCASRKIIHMDGRISPHKCRSCLRSE